MDELFAAEDVTPWRREWQNMPEYTTLDLEPRYQILISFATGADVVEFGELIGQKLKPNPTARQLRSLWFPEQEIGRFKNKRYIDRT